jgi:hypothetical protein
MPTDGVEGDCTYIKDGYIGYTFPGTDVQTDFPCPPSFVAAGDGGEAWFCTLNKGAPGFTDFPAGATAACDQAAEGVFGYEWPR